jgi:hypothetical protein
MAKRIPAPTITFSTPKYKISNDTAVIKARRLMKELKEYGGAKNFEKNCAAIGFTPDASPTRRWQAILKMPKHRGDLFGAWYDKGDQIMIKPDPKKTTTVRFWFLASNTPPIEATDDTWTALFLTMAVMRRREFLNPQTVNNQTGIAFTLIKVTLHSLQRMIQRGFVLTENGEISFMQLLECLMQVWVHADERYREECALPAEYKIEYEGAIFVIKAAEDYWGQVAMTLVTMLPPKK